MAKAKFAGFYFALDRGRKPEQAKEICYGGAIFPSALRHLLLGHMEIAAQPIISASLFHRVQVGALEIFDNRHLHRLFVTYLAKNRGYGFLTRLDGSTPAAFAGNQLEAAIGLRTHDDGLNHPVGDNGASQLVELLLVHLHARLIGIGIDLIGRNFARGSAGVGFERIVGRMLRRHCARLAGVRL